MDLGLKDRVVLVTGAAKGCGAAIALSAAQEGAHVVVNYARSAKEAEETVEAAKAMGVRSVAVQADVGNRAEVRRMFQQIKEQFGRLDGLVNNAGPDYIHKFFMDTSEEEWGANVQVGLMGVLNCCWEAIPMMIEQGGGKIVSISGDSARVGESHHSPAAAARGGVISFTKSLAREVGRNEITVNVVSMGLVHTHSTTPFVTKEYQSLLLRNFYPIKRLGETKDVAGIAVFLLSQRADWITGQTISANGGYCMP